MQEYKKKTFFFKNFSVLQKFLKILYDCLKNFLGPLGKNCILFEKNELYFLTNGINLLKNLSFYSKEANLIVQLIEQACLKTFAISSNGTTLTSFFSSKLLLDSFKFLVSGYNSIFLSNGLLKIAHFSIERLNNYSIEVKKISQLVNLVKTVFTKNEYKDITKILIGVILKFKKDGIILIEDSNSNKNEIEIYQGIEIEKGFLSSYFVNDFKNFEINYKNPYILISKYPINSLNQLNDVINFCNLKNRALIIITESIEKKVLSQLILRNIKKKAKIAVIKYNSIKFLNTELLNDLSILTHSNYLNVEAKKFTIADLGNAERVIIKKNKSFFIVSKFSKLITVRKLKELTKKLLTAETIHEKDTLKTRIARLSGNISKIKLSKFFKNTYELEFLKKKIEQSLETLKSSIEEGIIPGGNTVYFAYSKELSYWSLTNLIGDEIICSKLVNSLLKNLFSEFSIYNPKNYKISNELKTLEKSVYTYNFTKKRMVNCFKDGLIDSSKVIRGVFWNSLSLVSNILRTI